MSKTNFKHKGWSTKYPPLQPNCPSKPEKEFIDKTFKSFYTSYGDHVLLSEMPLPDGINLSDVVIMINGYYEDSIKLDFGTYQTTIVENKKYKQQMDMYNKKYTDYLIAKEAYKQTIIEWELWRKQKEESIVKQEIAKATKILKKHKLL